MFPGRRLPFPSSSSCPRADEVARFPDEPKLLGSSDEGSSRMSDEGCPNESPSVDDATGYSANSIGCDEVL